MKKLIVLLSLFLFACSALKTTDTLLSEIWNNDQQPRQQMLKLTKAVMVDGRAELIDSLLLLNKIVERNDKRNIKVIDNILKGGLPQGLSEESYKTIWIVIDHASLDKQEQYLPLIEEMSQNGLIGKDEHAILYDRIAMKRNYPQRYGSQTVQFGKPDTMNLYVYPVENPALLDSLRSSVGMSPMEEYLKQLTKTTGIEAKYDAELTIEQIEAMRGIF